MGDLDDPIPHATEPRPPGPAPTGDTGPRPPGPAPTGDADGVATSGTDPATIAADLDRAEADLDRIEAALGALDADDLDRADTLARADAGDADGEGPAPSDHTR